MKTKLAMTILTLIVSASSFASECRVLSEPDSARMYTWAAAHRKDAVEHAAAKNKITLVATGERRTHIHPGIEYDFAIVEREELRPYVGVTGSSMLEVSKYYDITDANGTVVSSILAIKQRTRNTAVRFEPTGNFEGVAINKAMKEIRELCN